MKIKPNRTYIDLEILFDGQPEESISTRGVIGQRTRTIKSGAMLEVESFPIWDTSTRRSAEERAKAMERNRMRAERANRKRAGRQLTRLINANFDERDLYITLTYENSAQPEDIKAARRDVTNYLNRIKRWRKRRGMDDLKYIYVTESKKAADGRWKYHHHMVMSGMERDEAERIWGHGHANTRRLQMDNSQFSALAAYMIKNPAGKSERIEGYMQSAGKWERKWCCSKGLKRARPTINDHKISRRQAERMARDTDVTRYVARDILRQKYKGYDVVSVEVNTSPYVPGIYIYARMRRKN